MSDPAVRLRRNLDTARQRLQTDRGAVAIREVVAVAAVGIIVVVAAVALLEVAGFDVAGWMRDQLGIVPWAA